MTDTERMDDEPIEEPLPADAGDEVVAPGAGDPAADAPAGTAPGDEAEEEAGEDRAGEEAGEDRAGDNRAGGDGYDDRPEPATPEEVADTARDFVTGLLEAMGLEGEVSTSVEGTTARVDVAGEHLGAVIGRRGQTLDALQEVTRAAVQRRLRSRVRLAVDVEGYRARRRDSLAEYAREMASRAQERGTEIELEPMTSYERKVVHDAVAEVDGASSFSEGEEPNRKVVIRGD